jgi:pimeloyl-ACP methyl ester carboxylesterase/tetratricopeptide (TPR) repeat protein
MRRANRASLDWRLGVFASVAVFAVVVSARGEGVVMLDGRVMDGKLAKLPSISNKQSPTPHDTPKPKSIYLCEDGLKRYFFPSNQTVRGVPLVTGADKPEKFTIKQKVASGGSVVTSVGVYSQVTPFDEFGRRKIVMPLGRKQATIYQGITEITPTWTKVEGLKYDDSPGYIWDQRIATNSIPHELLDKILRNQVDPKNIEQRLKIARLYIQMERYDEARKELAAIIKDFPDRKDDFARTERELRQRYALRALSEIKNRRDAGQHQLVVQYLENFPSEGVAGDTLQTVKEMIDQYKAEYARGLKVLEKIDELLAKVVDTKVRERLSPLRDEIKKELNLNTLPRMAAFEQAIEDDELSAEEKLAIGFSGWLISSDQSLRNLAIASSLFAVRNKVRSYLEEPLQPTRAEILSSLEHEEGATLERVTLLLANMLPTRPPGEPEEGPRAYKYLIDGAKGEPPHEYFVQLPPEYDPHRVYPTIVTLCGAGMTPQAQLDWWAGQSQPDVGRVGHAARFGYIVIAPAWTTPAQGSYNYSLTEHMAVLNTLRDATRRFAIDSDRVFLSGHDIGGDAAWDIGLAHPDLWAGVIPIVAVADKYVNFYYEVGKEVPFYVIGGEMDGNKTAQNSLILDRWLTGSGYNITVAEFLGRGHEHFADETLRLFDWMGRLKRNFARKEIVGRSMRPFDSFYWWLDLGDYPEKAMVDSEDWPLEHSVRTANTSGKITDTNAVHVTTGAGRITIWLSPELVDFGRKISIKANNANVKAPEPSLEVLLEDARSRGIRLHPFWAKVEAGTGRRVAELKGR